MRFLYTFFVDIYNILIFIVSPFNKKANLIVEGRKRTFDLLKENIFFTDKVAWFHCSSLGEFEQGRPLIEDFKKTFPDYKILLSFFSPSGYEFRKNYEGADVIVYLPTDNRGNAKKFVSLANPKFVFFIKYEFWFNYINEIHKYGAKLFQVSLILRSNQYFFSWYGKWFRRQLNKFDYFFVQNSLTKELLNSIYVQKCIISGDTRFDRVVQISAVSKDFNLINEFCGEEKIILAGSSWEKDEQILKEAFEITQSNYKVIIAPHEVNQSHINFIIDLFPSAIKYSELDQIPYSEISSNRVLIIDCIGILSSIYKYSTIAYIGGGFGAGIHNILEAATFGKPICFGNKYHKFQEAVDLVNLGGAFVINNIEELSSMMDNLLLNDESYKKSSDICLSYVNNNIGACKKILAEINSFI
ncbi:MAG: 3-deoxy-D-manno-octulosonic acid transferase [Bacteroidetes bacterium]|nr:3-deoxy-D-manno-octulosonic acid transferase [Bacteroidota bacterium]